MSPTSEWTVFLSSMTRQLNLRSTQSYVDLLTVYFVCLRAHEQDLTKRHERDLGDLSIVHHREIQIMLADFNKAQEVLKDKIAALQILWVTEVYNQGLCVPYRHCRSFLFSLCPLPHMSVCVCRLEGTEDKLRNRESRPEDLHLIAELRELVSEREALVKKLVVRTLCSFWEKL